MGRSRRWQWGLIATAVLGVSLLGVLFCELHWRRMLSRKEAELRAQGLPLSLEEYLEQRETLPPEANSALVFLELAQLLRETRPESREVAVGLATASPFGEKPSEHSRQLIRRCLDENAEALAIIRRGAELPRGVYPLGEYPGPDMYMPHLGLLRSAGELCAVKATERAAAGDGSAAAESLRNSRRLNASLQEPATLAEGVVRMAFVSGLFSALEDTLGLVEMPHEAVAMLQSELRAEREALSLADAARGEIGLCYHLFRHPEELAGIRGWPGGLAHAIRLVPSLRERNAIGYLEVFSRLVQVSQLPLRERWLAGSQFTEGWERTVVDSRNQLMLARQLLPSLARLIRSDVAAHVELQVAEAALAVEQWRLEHGRWPESLEELTPELLEAVPEDPFADGPIRYLHTDRGVVLYSLGPDGKDHGGRSRRELRQQFERLKDLGPDCGDIAFRLLAPEHRGARTRTLQEDLAGSRLTLNMLEDAGITRDELLELGLTEEDVRPLEAPDPPSEPPEWLREMIEAEMRDAAPR